MVPPSRRTRPKIARIAVVLPAPFGPRKPNIRPDSTPKVQSSRATVPPYRLCKTTKGKHPARLGSEREGYLRAMVSSSATTVAEYLAELPPDRRQAISEVRKMIRANLPKGYKESMTWRHDQL